MRGFDLLEISFIVGQRLFGLITTYPSPISMWGLRATQYCHIHTCTLVNMQSMTKERGLQDYLIIP